MRGNKREKKKGKKTKRSKKGQKKRKGKPGRKGKKGLKKNWKEKKDRTQDKTHRRLKKGKKAKNGRNSKTGRDKKRKSSRKQWIKEKIGRKVNKVKGSIESTKERSKQGIQRTEKKTNQTTGGNDCIDVVSDKAILYKRYNNQLRQITRMLQKSKKAESKRDKAKTEFNRASKAISGATLDGTSCPGAPSEKSNSIQAYKMLQECKTTAFSICGEAVLPTSDKSLAETCKEAMETAVKAFEVTHTFNNLESIRYFYR